MHRRFLIWWFLIFSACKIWAQTATYYLPFNPLSGAIFQYSISNPESIICNSTQSPDSWYLEQAISPCYRTGSYTDNGDISFLNSISGDYELEKLESGYSIISIKTDDPFLQQSSRMIFENEMQVVNSLKEVGNEIENNFNAFITYSKDRLPIQLQKYVTTYDYLKVRFNLEQSCVQGMSGNVYLPMERVQVKSIEVTESYSSIEFLVSNDKKSWQKLNQSNTESLSDWFPELQRYLKYFVDSNDLEVAKIEFDSNLWEKSLAGYYNLDKPNNRMPSCSSATKNIYLFPNPSFGNFDIQLQGHMAGNYALKIYNIIGQELYSKSFNSSGNDKVSMQLAGINKGTYIYSIIDPNGEKIQTRRLLILSL